MEYDSNASYIHAFIRLSLQCVLQCDLWLPRVINFVTHSFPLQMPVPGTRFVCAGQTCLCSWLLWWGGTAQQPTHLSLLRWGDAGGHLQVHRYSALFVCVCEWVWASKSDKINYSGLGSRISFIIIYYISFLTIHNNRVLSFWKHLGVSLNFNSPCGLKVKSDCKIIFFHNHKDW